MKNIILILVAIFALQAEAQAEGKTNYILRLLAMPGHPNVEIVDLYEGLRTCKEWGYELIKLEDHLYGFTCTVWDGRGREYYGKIVGRFPPR